MAHKKSMENEPMNNKPTNYEIPLTGSTIRPLRGIVCLMAILLLLAVLWVLPVYAAVSSSDSADIHLVIDGRDIDPSVTPMIVNGRTIVPVRLIAEELGADVAWDGESRTVMIQKGDRAIRLRIDSRLIEHSINGSPKFYLSDVAPKIYFDRTFVPIRLISNALGVGIGWDDPSRTVTISSGINAELEPFFDMKINSVQNGSTIYGKTILKSTAPAIIPLNADRLDYVLIDPSTGKGVVVARGTDFASSYEWMPSMRDRGQRVLIAALYDHNGTFLCGDAVSVNMSIMPEVYLSGLKQDQIIDDAIDLVPDPNFSAAYVKYQFTNIASGNSMLTKEQDPKGKYRWDPGVEYNGAVAVKIIAYDEEDRAYESQTINVNVQVPHKIELKGVTKNQRIESPVTLIVARNFDVLEMAYILRDVKTGMATILQRSGYGNCFWFPGPDSAGEKEVLARVKSTEGVFYTSDAVPVTVVGTPKIILRGVGPGQIITRSTDPKYAVNLSVVSNVELQRVKYSITNIENGGQKVLKDMNEGTFAFSYTPDLEDSGQWQISATGTYGTGLVLNTEKVPVTIFTGKTYGPRPIIEKELFLALASSLSREDWMRSGMSAALQTAQSILETGWGQSVPVDKYNGRFSYNLFGIKGFGPAGSVISNTWEEYNGVSYRTDASFRAYNNVAESWEDHNKLLMTRERYADYREVMFDSTMGAWALKRAGYATDSQYPVKLIRIIRQYDLVALDQIAI